MKMDDVRSVGQRTELFISELGGTVTEAPGHLIVRTPSNPGYYHGNMLFFPRPPEAADIPQWRAEFARVFGDDPRIRHQTFTWDTTSGERGASEEFGRAGFNLDDIVVLAAAKLLPRPPPPPGYTIRRITTDEDWAQCVDVQVICRGAGFDPGPYFAFKHAQFAAYRAIAEKGSGAWLGAFFGEDLAADLGIFWGKVGGSMLARYQSVETHPDHRRKGLCGALLAAAAEVAISRGAQKLVILADPAAEAQRVYLAAGLQEIERTLTVWLPPPKPS